MLRVETLLVYPAQTPGPCERLFKMPTKEKERAVKHTRHFIGFPLCVKAGELSRLPHSPVGPQWKRPVDAGALTRRVELTDR